MRVFAVICVALGLTLHAAPVVADTPRRVGFDLLYGPVIAARLSVTYTQTARRYQLRARIDSAGVLDLFRRARMDAQVEGRRSNGGFFPQSYRGDMSTGDRDVQVEMRYRNRVPQIVSLHPQPPRESWTLNAADQTGVPDPMTALFALLRPRPSAELCGSSQLFFDGRHLVRLQTAAARINGSQARCEGRYSRLGGYAPEQLRRRTGYDFTLNYAQDGDGLWHLMSGRVQTILGAARLRRQEAD